MKRIFSVLAVTALMVAMLVASVSPVFAKPPMFTAVCHHGRPDARLHGERKVYSPSFRRRGGGGWECSDPCQFRAQGGAEAGAASSPSFLSPLFTNCW